MTPDTPNPASAAAQTGSGDTCLLGGEHSPDSTPRQNTQGKKSGGRASRDKGNRFERAVVRLLQDAGFGAERIPLSGSAGGSFSGDVTTLLIGCDRVLECKSRKNGFRELYRWLENCDAVILRSDRHDALAVVRLRFAVEVAVAAEKRKP
jgi:Holliday junction resolvase